MRWLYRTNKAMWPNSNGSYCHTQCVVTQLRTEAPGVSTERAISASPPGVAPDGGDHAPKGSDIDRVVERLADRFPSVPPRDVHDVVHEEFSAFDGARIPTFVPVLAAKAAIERLSVGNTTDGSDFPGVAPGHATTPHDQVVLSAAQSRRVQRQA